MRPADCLFAFGVGILLTLLSSRTDAQLVVLVRPPVPDQLLSEAFNRLRAELALEGFETTLVTLDPQDDSPAGLAAIATRSGALASISLSRRVGAPSADVCIADRVTGKKSVRTLDLGTSPDAANVLAVRTADLLRASLREFSAGQQPPADIVGVDTKPVPEAVKRFTKEAPARFRVNLRAAALGITERIGPGYAPSLGLEVRLLPRFGVGIALVGPALGASYATAVGSADVSHGLALARVWGTIMQAGRLELRGELALGAYHLEAHSNVAPPLAPRNAGVTSFAAGLGLDAAMRLSQRLVVDAGVSAYTLSPRPAVAVLENQYAFAVPFVTAMTGFGVDF